MANTNLRGKLDAGSLRIQVDGEGVASYPPTTGRPEGVAMRGTKTRRGSSLCNRRSAHRLLVSVTVAFIGCVVTAVAGPEVWDVTPAGGGELESVNARIKAFKRAHRRDLSKTGGVVVRLAPGRYSTGGKAFRPESGVAGAPIVWEGAGVGKTFISAGLDIPVSLFSRVKEGDPMMSRIDKTVRARVLVADLSSLPIVWPTYRDGEYRFLTPAVEVFVDAKRQTLARWPNGMEWAEVAPIVDPRLATKNRPAEPLPIFRSDGVFNYSGDRPSRWLTAQDAWIHAYWRYDWAASTLQIKSIDTEAHQVSLKGSPFYGYGKGNPKARRWYVENLLEELDAPGEFFLDVSTKRLYLLPVSPLTSKTRISVSSGGYGGSPECDLIRFGGNTTWRNITFEEAYENALYSKRVSDVLIENCEVRNCRARAIFVEASSNVVVRSVRAYDTGTGGIYIGGGDRKLLIPGNNLIENCEVWNCAVHRRSSSNALSIEGVGNTIRHCYAHDLPHQAIGVGGNDNIIEYNRISNVCNASDDASAFYKGRNPSMCGNVIRYNYFDTVGTDYGHGTAAIYFDDGSCGDLVFGNVFRKCGWHGDNGSFGAIFVHGGYANKAENNIFIDCKRGLGYSQWDNARWPRYLNGGRGYESWKIAWKLTNEVDITSSLYRTRYPFLKDLLAPLPLEKRINKASRNVFVNCGTIHRNWIADETNITFDQNPGFVDAAKGNYALRSDSPVFRRIPDFEAIPFEKIGLLNR